MSFSGVCRITAEHISEGRKNYTNFLEGSGNNFFSALFAAIALADSEGIRRLAAGFPGEVYAYEEVTNFRRISFEIITNE
ncbi:MAG: hypothetical protein VR69_13885 [Peptococcaceae bacterium BRH_c4b]|nr:MAG: hypothetical protein VR69_13885 [Peptococcaceae bacterium BRH_c4b]